MAAITSWQGRKPYAPYLTNREGWHTFMICVSCPLSSLLVRARKPQACGSFEGDRHNQSGKPKHNRCIRPSAKILRLYAVCIERGSSVSRLPHWNPPLSRVYASNEKDSYVLMPCSLDATRLVLYQARRLIYVRYGSTAL